ncbi:MAG TPA: hypothetical protein VGH94_12610 [Acidimicrobiales bacterium]|jgi:hypothetical protein
MADRRILVVANRTLCERPLLDELHRRERMGRVSFHMLVPASHPHGTWTDYGAREEAQERLADITQMLAGDGIIATGEVVDANPVYGVGDVLRREAFDEIIVSTLPHGVSAWLANNVVRRMRAFGLPLTHVVATHETADL